MYDLIAVPRRRSASPELSPFPFEESDLYAVKSGRELISRFSEYLKSSFAQGYPVDLLLKSCAKALDYALGRLYAHFHLDDFQQLCLMAVGGYGRREQFPGSDVDLLVISSSDHLDEKASEAIGRFISYLWDLKLDLGASVRSINATLIESRKDITIITNLLETHYICGSRGTYKALCTALANDDFWDSGKFYRHKVIEQKQRYHQYRDTVYSIEPDVKNNPGGLRDLQVMQWIAIMHFDAGSPQAMRQSGIITSSELDEFLACRDFLFNMRYALHCTSTQPHSNRLTLDVQKAVAAALGYGSEGNEPVEMMMRALFRIFRRVRELNTIVIEQADIMLHGQAGTSYAEPVFLNSWFVKRGELIDVIDHELFKHDPQKLLRLFRTIAKRGGISNLHVNCLRALRESRRSFRRYLIEIPECRRTFKKILLDRRSLRTAIPLMHETRVLSAYMPQWERIEGLTQFDMFHLFSVDEHTVRVLKNFAEFSESKEANFQLFRSVYHRLESPELLNVAGMLHDMCKGCGGHHSELGAAEAENFCQMHGFSSYETSMVAWIVRWHLLFSTTATRRDITDPEVISAFARICKDEEHLNMLYCLTIADICATNDREWTSWKENIFRQLYQSARQVLNHGFADTTHRELLVQNTQTSVREICKDCGRSDVDRYFGSFPASYFIHYRPDEVAWHLRNILRFTDSDKPLILFSQIPNIGTEVLIFYRSNSQTFFGKVVYAMAMKRLNVLSAQIFLTHTGHILCTIKFQNQKGQFVDNDRLNNLRKFILAGLNNDTPLEALPRVQSTLFSVPTRISFLPQESAKHTGIEITTLDSPGLLAKIGITFGSCGCLIASARVATTGERADDFFAVTDTNGLPLDDSRKQTLSQALYEALEGHNEQGESNGRQSAANY